MGRHLPPPQNKHLKHDEQSDDKLNIRKSIRVSADKDTEKFSYKALAFLAASLAVLLVSVFLKTEQKLIGYGIIALSLALAIILLYNTLLSKILALDFLDDSILVTVAAIGILCLGQFQAGVAVIIALDLVILARAYAAEKERQSSDAIMQLRVETAKIETSQGTVEMSAKEIPVGSIMHVPAGEKIALDAIVVDGMSSVDTSALTADNRSLPVAPGRLLVSGCINLTRPLKVKVYRAYEDSTLTRLLEYVQNAKHFKSKQEKSIQRFANVYTPLVLTLALVVGIIVPLFSGDWVQWLKRAFVLVAIASPKTLMFSISLAYSGAISKAAKGGAIIRGANILEELACPETMIFDKTGTVTDARFSIIDVCPSGVDEAQLLSIAAHAEYYSNHAIARLIKAAAGISGKEAEANILKVEELPGRGVSAFVNKKQVYVGTAMLLEEHGIKYEVPQKAGTAIHVAVNNQYYGYILVSDKIKSGSFDALEAVKHQGVKRLVLLTGDTMTVSRPIASALNFDLVKAELRPDAKISALEYLLASKSEVASLVFVGDAETDSVLIERADVGVALGALGSAKALDSADVILCSNDLRKVPFAMQTALLSSKTVRQNCLCAIAVKALCLLLGALGAFPLLVVAIIETAAQLAVIVNSLNCFDKSLITRAKKDQTQS